MRGGCLLAVGARRARGSNKFSSVPKRSALHQPLQDRRGTYRLHVHVSLLACRQVTGIGSHRFALDQQVVEKHGSIWGIYMRCVAIARLMAVQSALTRNKKRMVTDWPRLWV